MVNFTAPSPFPHQIQSGALNDLNRRELIKNMKKEEMDRKEGDGEATEGAVDKPVVKKQKTGESNERITASARLRPWSCAFWRWSEADDRAISRS